jgi:SAM-dependent methyltransferase
MKQPQFLSVLKWPAKRARTAMERLSGVWPPRLGAVTARDIAGTRPVSNDFGWDRGVPIDRYYIEAFLAKHADDIRGRVLEIGDAAYCRRFGGDRIKVQDVLHVSADAKEVTIVGDLQVPGTLPAAAFNCIVATQTLQVIFDFNAALDALARAMRPGGVLLLTVPGISPIDRGEWSSVWYWTFTQQSLSRLAAAHFPGWDVRIVQHGNIFAAISFLHGLSAAEVDPAKLDVTDAAFPVTLTLYARRPTNAS